MKPSVFYLVGLRNDSGRDEIYSIDDPHSPAWVPAPHVIGDKDFIEEMNMIGGYYSIIAKNIIRSIENGHLKEKTGRAKREVLKIIDYNNKETYDFVSHYQDKIDQLIVYNILL